MYVEIETVAAQFLFWEYINGIFVAVWCGGVGVGAKQADRKGSCTNN
jgi:hypothetical protein